MKGNLRGVFPFCNYALELVLSQLLNKIGCLVGHFSNHEDYSKRKQSSRWRRYCWIGLCSRLLAPAECGVVKYIWRWTSLADAER